MNILAAAALAAALLTTQSCAGLGVPAPTLAAADHVTVTTEQALIIANDADDALILAVERHVQAGDIHGADAGRVRQALATIGQTLDAAAAAQRLGQDAVVSAKAGDAIRLITGLTHDFPVLASTLRH